MTRASQSLLDARTQGVERRAAGYLSIEAIRPGKSQPRSSMREGPLRELAASIKANGVIQPIVVRPVAGLPERYEIVAGERRWLAAKLAGLTEIPAVVRELSDSNAAVVGLIENIQREDLTPTEEARSLQRLITEFSLTHVQVAEAVGRSRASVSNLLRLLDLPERVLDLVETRALSMGHARALLGLEGDEQRTRLAVLVAERRLPVRETENLVRETLKPPVAAEPPPPAELTAVSDVISNEQVHVRLHQSSSGGGRLVVDFKDTETRDEIVAAIKYMFDGEDSGFRLD
jgi:ParB family chromosome partitioning protein